MKNLFRVLRIILYISMIIYAFTGIRIVHAEEEGTFEEEALAQDLPTGIPGEAGEVWATMTQYTFGTAGRLYSPDLGINVGLYYYDMMNPYGSNEEAQWITDSYDSAIWMDWHINTQVIGDHWNQGFEAIKQAVPGQTVLYKVADTGLEKYICTDIQEGHNDGHNLIDANGSILTEVDPGGIVLYTCNGSWKNITMVYFTPIAMG